MVTLKVHEFSIENADISLSFVKHWKDLNISIKCQSIKLSKWLNLTLKVYEFHVKMQYAIFSHPGCGACVAYLHACIGSDCGTLLKVGGGIKVMGLKFLIGFNLFR